MAQVNWNVLVKSKNNGKSAREALAEIINPENKHYFDSADEKFVSEQDWITAVPIEIALTVSDRKAIQEKVPGIKFIVTGVSEQDAITLTEVYGYETVFPAVDIDTEEDCEEEECENMIQSIRVDGITYSWNELKDIIKKHVKAKKLAEEIKNSTDDILFNDPLFRNFLDVNEWKSSFDNLTIL